MYIYNIHTHTHIYLSIHEFHFNSIYVIPLKAKYEKQILPGKSDQIPNYRWQVINLYIEYIYIYIYIRQKET